MAMRMEENAQDQDLGSEMGVIQKALMSVLGPTGNQQRLQAGMWATGIQQAAQSGLYEAIEGPEVVKALAPAIGVQAAKEQQQQWIQIAKSPEIQFQRALRSRVYMDQQDVSEEDKLAHFAGLPDDLKGIVTSAGIGQLSMQAKQLSEQKAQREQSGQLQGRALDLEEKRMGMPTFQAIQGRGTLVFPDGKSIVVGGQPQFPIDNETFLGFSQLKKPLTYDQISKLDPNNPKDALVIKRARAAGTKYLDANPDQNAWRKIAAKELAARGEGKPAGSAVPTLSNIDDQGLSQMVVGMQSPNVDLMGRFLPGAKAGFARNQGGATQPTMSPATSPTAQPTMTPQQGFQATPTATPSDAGAMGEQFPGATPGVTYSQMLANAAPELQKRDAQINQLAEGLNKQLQEQKIDKPTYDRFIIDLQKEAALLGQEVMKQGSNAGQLGQAGAERFRNVSGNR